MRSYFALSCLALFTGLIISIFLQPSSLLLSPFYNYLTYGILAIGLYGAVYGIDLKQLSRLKKSVFLVVTLGVLMKIFFIGTVLYIITGNIVSYLLACIVAQIDPLSITKLTENAKSKLSPKAEALLKAWASFDDPMTVLITFYILLPFISSSGTSIYNYFLNLGLNLLFTFSVFVLQKFVFKHRFELILLAISIAVGITFQLMFAIALIAIFLRPKVKISKFKFDQIVSHSVTLAYYISLIILGVLISKGIDLKIGVILGFLAFFAQILVTNILLPNFDKSDKLKLSLSQYNGITSIILSSLVVVYYDQTVAIVSVAIITISVLYFGVNRLIQSEN